jgi:5-aminolevulinate synthase
MPRMKPVSPPPSFDYEFFLEQELSIIKQDGRYRTFIEYEKDASIFPRFRFRKGVETIEAVNWCSNDYLGLSIAPLAAEVLTKHSSQSGVGSGGTRNISGTSVQHVTLERTLAAWHHQEAALLFNSAYQANLSTLATIGRKIPDLVFFSDAENHASLIEGMRLAGNEKKIFRHNDMHHLEELLNESSLEVPKLIVFESVYSISGTIAPIERLVPLAKKYGALTYVDEVHAVGLYGPTGAGKLEELECSHDITLINGTLSKAIGSFGGYIAGSFPWIDFIRSFASGFIFTTSLPPAICAVSIENIRTIQTQESLRVRFFEQVKSVRKALQMAGIPFTGDESHITNIRIGDAARCKAIADYLLYAHGIYLQPINQPTVAKGKECLRLIVSPLHQSHQIQHLVRHLAVCHSMNLRIIARKSALSQAQLHLVADVIKRDFPWIKISALWENSRGDDLIDKPLHLEEGSDFFTDRLTSALIQGTADLAVHSLKDLSAAHFFGDHLFAVVDREAVHDIVIFHASVEEKLRAGAKIRIGTCSHRRETLVLPFLQQALPFFEVPIRLEAVPIRGNIDTRIAKLDGNQYDGIVLALAGIHRALKFEKSRTHFIQLLEDKKWMILPPSVCTPAPAQGAIVVESASHHPFVKYLLSQLNNLTLYRQCAQEKSIAEQYGTGCIQPFGVHSYTIGTRELQHVYGKTKSDDWIDSWHGLDYPSLSIPPDQIICSDELGFKAIRSFLPWDLNILKDVNHLFISHEHAYKLKHNDILRPGINIWTAGINTWKKLAAKGIWISGCSDSMGFESLVHLLEGPLVATEKSKCLILTNTESAQRWALLGYKAITTYDLTYESPLLDRYMLRKAKLLFWNCFAHYQELKHLLEDDLIHACLPGQTETLLRAQGISPWVFPSLNAFTKWKQSYSQAYFAA